MKTQLTLLLVLSLSVAGSLLPSGCHSTETSERETVEVAPAAAPAPAPAPASKSGPWSASRLYPGDSAVRLDLLIPNEVAINASFDHTIRVTNTTDTVVTNVVVAERMPQSFKFERSEPAPERGETNLVWALGSLDPKASRDIKVSGTAVSTQGLKPCATVTFLVPVCANITVVEPKLMLTKTAPKEVLLCDPIPAQIVVTNNGSGSVQGVKIVDTLPAGWRTLDGRGELVLDAGTLAPGQSKQFAGTFKASKTGEYTNKATAMASGGLKAEAATTTIVRQPVLTIAKSAPARSYAGRPVTHEITVGNKGDAPAANLVVEDTLPEGVQGVQTVPPATTSGGKLIWQLGTLAVNTSKKISVTYTSTASGTLADTATASATCADTVTATAKTTVYGIAAVLLEVIDTDDPVPVGGQTTYIITATNQGSMASSNVQITCMLEDAEEFVSASGATRGKADGKTISFAPLPTLAPKAKATWQVVVKAVSPGDIRFTTKMTTAELDRSVDETEATQIYR